MFCSVFFFNPAACAVLSDVYSKNSTYAEASQSQRRQGQIKNHPMRSKFRAVLRPALRRLRAELEYVRSIPEGVRGLNYTKHN